jgi:hypothetical protein
MPFDKLKYPDELWEERRKRVQESLQPISVTELKEIARQHEEEFLDDPWRDEFLRLIETQPQAAFYQAYVPEQDIVVYYCRDADFGVWVVGAGSGMGSLDEAGKRIMKESIANPLSRRKMGEKK